MSGCGGGEVCFRVLSVKSDVERCRATDAYHCAHSDEMNGYMDYSGESPLYIFGYSED